MADIHPIRDAADYEQALAEIDALVTILIGPLAYGSIVAREYGITVVMDAGVATKRI